MLFVNELNFAVLGYYYYFFLLLILRQLKVFNDIKDMKLVCQSIKFARKTIASGKSSSIALLLKTLLSINVNS